MNYYYDNMQDNLNIIIKNTAIFTHKLYITNNSTHISINYNYIFTYKTYICVYSMNKSLFNRYFNLFYYQMFGLR